jgi:hypothetical protein
MTKKIEEFLGEKEPKFVVVGSAHMVGEKGIVKLLEASPKKYKIERPDLTPAPKSEKKPEAKKDAKKSDKKKDDDDD